ncbi:S-adenosyl-L-methionine-dependent methyltransferase [Exidia glandulosa HHB12029]|uniref:S-adenosyl-L-methionine-dependent methyltransferase n=1 Tax=Exidia glandulosa HHB12029 TaxID=1314781 RepID=A0A165GN50_EXIGL|nr:S-adenosyl-L-methionine-dependent methyltransferase [Exidia glandulosa HHB12029]
MVTVDEAAAEYFQLVDLIRTSVQGVLDEYTAASRPVPTLDCTNPFAVLNTQGVRDAVRVLEGAYAQLIASIAPAQHVMLNGVDPACINVALTTKVADQLDAGPMPVAELATKSGVDAAKLGRVLRCMAIQHCFTEVEKDVYANNKLSVCLRSSENVSGLLGFVCVYAQSQLYLSDEPPRSSDDVNMGLAHLAQALTRREWIGSSKTNASAYVLAHGQTLFEKATVEVLYPWSAVRDDTTFCDIGGSVGHVSMALLKANPSFRVVVHDLPSVIEEARKVWQREFPEAVDQQSVQLLPLDFVKQRPLPGCNYYYLKHVLHDWPDADCVTILENIRASMTSDGSKLLLHEFTLRDATRQRGTVTAGSAHAPEPLLPNFGAGVLRHHLMDVNMLSTFNSAERTLDDFIRIGQVNAAGFRFVRIWEGGEVTVLEFTVQPVHAFVS